MRVAAADIASPQSTTPVHQNTTLESVSVCDERSQVTMHKKNMNFLNIDNTLLPNPDPVGIGKFRGSGSVSISTQCKAKLYFYPKISKYCQNIIESYDTYDTDEKDKRK